MSGTVGKTVGISLTAVLLGKAGFSPPGLNLKTLVMVGYIASVGLTVSLFVAGAAYENDGIEGEIQSQAKIGVLCAMFNGIVAVIVAHGLDLDEVKVVLSAEELQANKDAIAERLRQAQLERAEHPELMEDSEDDDEFLEHVVAIEYVLMVLP